jgi:hypothetical protein
MEFLVSVLYSRQTFQTMVNLYFRIQQNIVNAFFNGRPIILFIRVIVDCASKHDEGYLHQVAASDDRQEQTKGQEKEQL